MTIQGTAPNYNSDGTLSTHGQLTLYSRLELTDGTVVDSDPMPSFCIWNGTTKLIGVWGTLVDASGNSQTMSGGIITDVSGPGWTPL